MASSIAASSRCPPECIKRLEPYDFPGSVRALEFAHRDRRPADLRASRPVLDMAQADCPPDGIDLDRMIADFERMWVLRVLEPTNGIRKRAATLLNISFRSLRYRLEKLAIDRGDDEEPT